LDILQNNICEIFKVVLIAWITMVKKLIINYKLQVTCSQVHLTQTHLCTLLGLLLKKHQLQSTLLS
jgi:hypothetical protein